MMSVLQTYPQDEAGPSLIRNELQIRMPTGPAAKLITAAYRADFLEHH